MSIRWKFFLTLFALTVLVSAGVLWFAEREMRNWVVGEVEQRFAAQVENLLRGRQERLEEVREACRELAHHPAVRAAAAGEMGEAERQAMVRLMESRPWAAQPPNVRHAGGGHEVPGETLKRERPGTPRTATRAPLMGVVRESGEVVFFGKAMAMRKRPDATKLKRHLAAGDQQVAYVVFAEGSLAERAKEMVLTPVNDGSGKATGFLFLGLDAATPDERAFIRAQEAQGSDGRTGLVIDGEWFMPGLKEDETKALADAVQAKDLERGKSRLIRTAVGSVMVTAHELESAPMQGSVHQVGIYPMDPLLAAIGRMRKAVLWCGAAGTLVAAMSAWGMARRFSRPITDLVAGTERVRQGDFKTPVAVRSRDELGKLAHAFNGMTRDLELKDRYHEVLGQVSDPAVAKQLLEGSLQLGGEVREVAVLFCDIRGFTALTEKMAPQEVIEMLNRHMTALTQVVHAHGGVVDKFVGDLVMALFGAPVSHGNDSLQAVRCALAMMEERARLNRISTPFFEMGIGLASGPVVAGCMGSDTRLNYTVLGERVNLASRLCSAAAAGEILIDETLARAVAGECTVEAREPAKLKGFSAPVPVFAVAG